MTDPEPVEPVTVPTLPAEGESSVRDLTTGSAGTLVLLVLVFVCYAWTVRGGYIWDDNAYVTGNSTLRDFNGLSRIWTQPGATPQYYPLTFTSFWLETRLFGFKPAVSHIVNAMLHAGSVLLLWKILRRLSVPGAWMAAAVFAVHPMNVESVAWIAERKNTLSMILALSATYLYLAYARLGIAERTTPVGEGLNVPMPDDPKRLYRLFLALFVLALLAKTAVAPLPLMLLAILWWKRGRIDFQVDVMPLLPALAIAAVGGAITAYVEHSPKYVGASGAEWDITVAQRVLLLGQTMLFYFAKILWPFPVGWQFAAHRPLWPFAISFNYYRWTPDPTRPLQWLPLAAIVGVFSGLWALRGRIGRAPFTVAILFFVGLLPVSGLTLAYPMRYSWVADHFAYVGQIGLIVGVVAGVTLLLRRWESVAAGVGSVALLALTGLTFWHALSFTDLRSLWERTLRQNPQSWLAALNYGGELMDIANDEYARRMSGDDSDIAAEKRESFRNSAEIWFREALRLKPDAYEAEARLGELAFQRGKIDEALAYYRKSEATAEALNSNYRFASFRIGEVTLAQGKIDEAIELFKKLEAKEGTSERNNALFAQVHTRVGDALQQQLARSAATQPDTDKLAAVIDEYNTAITLAPDYVPPKVRLAAMLVEQDQVPDALPQAVQLLQDVLKLDVDNIDAKLISARVMEKQKRPDLAAAQLTNLTERYPDFIPGHLQRAIVLQAMGQPDEAKAGLRKMLEKYPNAKPVRELLDQMEGRPSTRPAGPTTLQFGPQLPTPTEP